MKSTTQAQKDYIANIKAMIMVLQYKQLKKMGLTALVLFSTEAQANDQYNEQMVKLAMHHGCTTGHYDHRLYEDGYTAPKAETIRAIDGALPVIEVSSDKLDMPPTLEQLAAMQGEK